MSKRSNFILGDYVFIKVVTLNDDQGIRLAKALVSEGNLPPFTSNEFLINYLITKENKLLLDNTSLPTKDNSLLSPGTIVLVSGYEYNLSDFDKYKNISYDETITEVKTNFIDMDEYLSNISRLNEKGKYIKTAVIISKKVTGNYNDFLEKYSNDSEYNRLFEDSLIHISYLYKHFQENYQAVHGDPKIQNYTWLELDTPINIIYDFRDKYNDSNNRIIRRKEVKHLFYMTDLEFIFSLILKTVNINDNTYYFDFAHQAAWYGEDNNNDRIYVPKISSELPYQHNFNLYGGYWYQPEQDLPSNPTLYDYFNGVFPRMYSIDLLVLIKMFLTYWYAGSLNGSNIRKLNIYFTQFISLSQIEQNPHRRDETSYDDVSPGGLAELMGSN